MSFFYCPTATESTASTPQPRGLVAYSFGMGSVLAILLAACLLAGCVTAPIPHALALEDERERCVREGRWWKAHDVPPACEMRIGD